MITEENRERILAWRRRQFEERSMTEAIKDLETKKYERVWAHNDRAYGNNADGDPVVDVAFELMGCKPGETLIDWGCGCGRPAAKFQAKGLTVVGFDIASNCMDPGLNVPFLKRCLWDLPADSVSSDYAFCTDVLEHIPPDYVGKVLTNMRKRTRKAAFIQVCTLPDTYGQLLNPPMTLHLTVMRWERWMKALEANWRVVCHLPEFGGKSRACFLCKHE